MSFYSRKRGKFENKRERKNNAEYGKTGLLDFISRFSL